MMGQDKPPQRSLFYTGIHLEKRVRHGDVLRKVAKLVDFEFVYGDSQRALRLQRQCLGGAAGNP